MEMYCVSDPIRTNKTCRIVGIVSFSMLTSKATSSSSFAWLDRMMASMGEF